MCRKWKWPLPLTFWVNHQDTWHEGKHHQGKSDTKGSQFFPEFPEGSLKQDYCVSPRSFWLGRSSEGNLYFQKVPGWDWWYWSRDDILETTVLQQRWTREAIIESVAHLCPHSSQKGRSRGNFVPAILLGQEPKPPLVITVFFFINAENINEGRKMEIGNLRKRKRTKEVGNSAFTSHVKQRWRVHPAFSGLKHLNTSSLCYWNLPHTALAFCFLNWVKKKKKNKSYRGLF